MRYTQEELFKKIGDRPLEVIKPAVPQATSIPGRSGGQTQQLDSIPQAFWKIIKDIPSDIVETGENIGRELQRGGELVQEVQSERTNPLDVARGTIGAGTSAGARAFGQLIMGAMKLPFAQQTEDQVGERVGEVAQDVIENEEVQEVSQALMGVYDSLPEEAQWAVDDALRVAELAVEGIGARGGGSLVRAGGRGLDTADTAVRQGARNAVTGAREGIVSGARNAVTRTTDALLDIKDRATQAFIKTEGPRKEALNRVRVMTDPATGNPVIKRIDDAFVATGDSPSEWIADALKRSAIDGDKTTTTQLQRLARSEDMDMDTLIKEFANNPQSVPSEGRGGTLNYEFQSGVLRAQQKALMNEQILPGYRAVETPIGADEIIETAFRLTDERIPSGRLGQTKRQIQKIIEDTLGVSGRGDATTRTLTAEQLHRLLTDMNAASRASNAKGGVTRQVWEVDAEEMIARSARQKLDEVAPEVTPFRQEYGELTRDLKVMGTLANKQIKVGKFVDQASKMTALVLYGAIPLTVSGGGALAAAAIVASLGANIAAKIVKSRRFNPQLRERLMQVVKSQGEDFVDEFVSGANRSNQRFWREELEKAPLLLPEGGGFQNQLDLSDGPLPGRPVQLRADRSIIDLPERTQTTMDALERNNPNIRTPGSDTLIVNRLKEQAGRYTSREAYINAVRNNPAWERAIERNGFTPEEVANLVF